MLTSDQCRSSDPRFTHLSDEEVLKIRDELYKIAKIGLADFLHKNGGSHVHHEVTRPTEQT